MGLISRVSSRTYRFSGFSTMTETYVIKNKIRLQLRKTRQRVIKNVKRDISKYEDSKEKNVELLEQLKNANIETVLHIVLSQKGNEKRQTETGENGEHKVNENKVNENKVNENKIDRINPEKLEAENEINPDSEKIE